MSNSRKEKARDRRHHVLESFRIEGLQHDDTTPCSCPNGLHSRKNYVNGTCQRDYSARYKALLARQ